MIPFVDLASQQAAIKDELNRRIAAVLAHGQYIMGPEVAEMEEGARALHRHASLHLRRQRY